MSTPKSYRNWTTRAIGQFTTKQLISKRLNSKPRRRVRKSPAVLGFDSLEARQLLATVQIDLSAAFNQDSIRNLSGGTVDLVDSPIDGVSRLITDSYAQDQDPVNGNGLPDNGFFSANAQHPNVQLGYNNDNDGSNVVFRNSGSTASTSIDLAQTQIGNYNNLHVFATATNGATDLQVVLQYSDGTESFTTTVTDWLGEITDGTISGGAIQYNLINGMDRDVNGFENLNDPAVFGLNFTVDPTRVLEGFSFNRVNGANLIVLGATGESTFNIQVDLTDGEGFLWDIRSDGHILGGSNDAFDRGFDHDGVAPREAISQDGRDVVIGPTTIGNVEVTRNIHVPDDQGYARFLEIVTNNTATEQNYTVPISSDLGSDTATVNVGTSSGDTIFTTADDWIVTDDVTDGGGDPTIAHVVSGTNGQQPDAATSSFGIVQYSYDLTLQPGETQIVMHFGAQNADRAAALALAPLLADLDLSLNPLAGLSATELEQIVNFDIQRNFVVSTDTDIADGNFGPGELSLREAIDITNAQPGSDTITFEPSVNTITLQGELVINDSVTITGTGADQLSISGNNGPFRVLRTENFTSLINVEIADLTIRDGGDGIANIIGAGILNRENLTLQNVTVTDNDTGGTGGGGIDHQGVGVLNVIGSTVANNRAGQAGGIATDGATNIINSTISNNTASGIGGGLVLTSDQGPSSVLTIINSTISGNTASVNGSGVSVNPGSQATIRNSTITDNRGRFVLAIQPTTTTLHNTIIAGNTNGTEPSVIGGSFVATSSFNLIGDPGNAGGGAGGLVDGSNGNIVGDGAGNAIAASTVIETTLADNGGPTLTHALVPGSLAIDAGNNAEAVDENGDPLTTDQRGTGFERTLNGNADETATVDIGAFESVFTGDLLVSTNADISDGNFGAGEFSLREAIELANLRPGADTITFAPNIFTGGDNSVIRLAQGELVVTDSLSIDGSSGGGVVFNGSNSRIVNFTGSSGDLTLTDLTITGGRATSGGGIRFTSNGTLTLNNSTVSGNSASGGSGGGIYISTGNVSLVSSTVSGNSTSGGFGGGIHSRQGDVSLVSSTVSGNSISGNNVFGNGFGGGISTSSGDVSLVSSTVSGNSTSGAFGGGISIITGNVSLVSSTVSGNSASGESSDGGGVFINAGDVSLVSSTVSGNSSSNDGGGIHSRQGDVSLVGSTVTGNSASGTGGGIFVFDFSSNASLTISNSIVAGNFQNATPGNSGTPNDLVPDPQGVLTINHSLIGVADGLTITGGNNLTGTAASPLDPLLDSLADNGGPTLTHALLSGSPAIDAGNDALAVDENGDPLTTDQIGQARFFDGNDDGTATVDIGAFEQQAIGTAGQYIFYNNSSFDGTSNSDAIAPDKVALREGQTATFENYTSYSRGINGIAIDLFNAGNISASDIGLRFGNADDVATFETLNSGSTIINLTTEIGAGVNGSDRVFIEFADEAITNGWLQVTVLANSNTGLTANDIFYFGNAIGESGNASVASGMVAANAIVNVADVSVARNNQTGFGSVDIRNTLDFDRSGVVNLADISIPRTNQSGFTPVILITPTGSSGGAVNKLPPTAPSTVTASTAAARISLPTSVSIAEIAPSKVSPAELKTPVLTTAKVSPAEPSTFGVSASKVSRPNFSSFTVAADIAAAAADQSERLERLEAEKAPQRNRLALAGTKLDTQNTPLDVLDHVFETTATADDFASHIQLSHIDSLFETNLNGDF